MFETYIEEQTNYYQSEQNSANTFLKAPLILNGALVIVPRICNFFLNKMGPLNIHDAPLPPNYCKESYEEKPLRVFRHSGIS